MGPDIATNLLSILRAMENVIIPAIDPEQSLAREQAHLTLIYLRLMQEQHDKIFHFRLQEIVEYSDLLTALLEKPFCDAVPAAAANARAAVEQAAPLAAVRLEPYDVFADTARALRDAADSLVADLIHAKGDNSAVEAEIASLLLNQAGCEARRERSWVARLGLDPEPEQLLALEELLSKSRRHDIERDE